MDESGTVDIRMTAFVDVFAKRVSYTTLPQLVQKVQFPCKTWPIMPIPLAGIFTMEYTVSHSIKRPHGMLRALRDQTSAPRTTAIGKIVPGTKLRSALESLFFNSGWQASKSGSIHSCPQRSQGLVDKWCPNPIQANNVYCCFLESADDCCSCLPSGCSWLSHPWAAFHRVRS